MAQFCLVVLQGISPMAYYIVKWFSRFYWLKLFLFHEHIYIVYDKSKTLLTLLSVLFVAEIVASIVLADTGLPKTASIPQTYIPLWTGCHYTSPTPPHYFTTWIPAMLFETLLFGLMLLRGWQIYKNNGLSSLLKSLIVDSFTYFFAILLVLVVNVIIIAEAVFHPIDELSHVFRWAIAIPCALGSRLLLNMRKRYYKSCELSGYSQEMSEMRGPSASYRVSKGIVFARRPGGEVAERTEMSAISEMA
ncbi:hypothetical protein M422DRAFT_265542 [Sphaerobolus stellatus SS14]|uniref:Unplaced genomic scaffold SPHSTscaffold_149, whole genome shotgun sequence n=1 Tax=Sphaerobolus stellatus (strain SS14) TaxID=990650 RepID=A0A0C9UD60_SPHS4|nr:hypothetical protein M422DRAFT_265542 [Sphaerobolus stellatus SS14]